MTMQPPGSPPGPPSPMGAGWPGYAPEHPKGTTVLVLGILSLVVCQILGPFAWSMGNSALQEIDAAGGMAPNRGQVVAGRILGIIGTVMLIIPLVVLAVFLIVAGVATVSAN